MKHFSQVFVESDGEDLKVTIKAAHFETLARVFMRVAQQRGVDLSDDKTETRIFDASTPETRAAADQFFDAFVAKRRAQDS